MKAYDIRYAAVSVLRDHLRRGVLDFPAAVDAVALVDGLWGGQASGMRRLFPHPQEEIEKPRRALRDRFASFLGPEALHGPVTEEEWAIVRRARDAHAKSVVRDWALGLSALPEGPWHPEDRAFLDCAVAACEAGVDVVYFVAMAITAKPDADLLPIFQRLVRVSPDHRDTLRDAYLTVRKELGLPPSAKEKAKGEASAPREWMDEPEDDEDEEDDDDDE